MRMENFFMKNILISKISDQKFKVTLDCKIRTEHIVTVDDKIYEDLTNKVVSKKELLQISFEFLLKKEQNSSILPSFELHIIQNYFPDYIDHIKSICEN